MGKRVAKREREIYIYIYRELVVYKRDKVRSWVQIAAPYTGWTFFHVYLL